MDDRQLDNFLREVGGSVRSAPEDLLDSVMRRISPADGLPAFWLAGTAAAGIIALTAAVVIGFGTARSVDPQPPELALFSTNPAFSQSSR